MALQTDSDIASGDYEQFTKRVKSSFSILGMMKLFDAVITFGLTLVLGWLLEPEDFGLYTLIDFPFRIMAYFAMLGVHRSVVQKKDMTHDALSSLFWTQIGIAMGLFLLSMAISPVISLIYDNPAAAGLFRWRSLTYFMFPLGVISRALMVKELKFGKLATWALVVFVAKSLFMVCLAVLGAGVWTLLGGTLFTSFFTAASRWAIRPFFPKLRLKIAEIRDNLKFGMEVAWSEALNFTAQNGDYFVVGVICGEKATGYYKMAYRFVFMALEGFVALINQVAFPAFAKLQDDEGKRRDTLLRLSKTVLLIMGSYLGLLFFNAESLISFYDEKWLPSVYLIKVLAVVGVFRLMGDLLPPLLLAMGKSSSVLKYTIGSTIILNTCFFIGVSLFGLHGISYAWAVGFSIVLFILTRLALPEVGLNLLTYVWALRSPLMTIGLVVAANAALFWLVDGLGTLPMVAISLVMTIGIVALFQLVFDKKGLAAMIDTLKKKKSR